MSPYSVNLREEVFFFLSEDNLLIYGKKNAGNIFRANKHKVRVRCLEIGEKLMEEGEMGDAKQASWTRILRSTCRRK